MRRLAVCFDEAIGAGAILWGPEEAREAIVRFGVVKRRRGVRDVKSCLTIKIGSARRCRRSRFC